MNELDAGIECDIDFVTEEELFYKQQQDERESKGMRSEDRSDSAVSVSTPRLPPPPVLKEYNYPQKVDQIRTFRRELTKSVRLTTIDASQRRLRNEHLIVNQAKVVSHLIDFVDLPVSKRMIPRKCTDAVDSPLFICAENFVAVNNEYVIEAHRKQCTKSYAEKCLYLRRKVEQICEFAHKIEGLSELSVPDEILAARDWTLQCLNDYSYSLDLLRRDDLTDPLVAIIKLKHLGGTIELVHRMIYPFLHKTGMWKMTDVEVFWNRFMFAVGDSARLGEKQKLQLARLQSLLISQLIRLMDCIFETARLPDDDSQFSYFMANPEGPEPPLVPRPEANIQDSALWDEELISVVTKAAMARVMASTKFLIEGEFSSTFLQILKLRVGQNFRIGEQILENFTFRKVFIETAKSEKSRLDALVVDALRENDDLNHFWEDLESIVIGRVALRYSMIVLNTDINVLNLFDVFWMSVRSEKAVRNQNRFLWRPSTKEFGCKLEKPLGYFIDENLVTVLNECRTISHNLHRTIELLLMIQRDKLYTTRLYQSRSESSEGFHGLAVDERTKSRTIRLKLRHVAFVTHQIVSYFKDMFNRRVQEVFRTNARKFASASLTLSELNAAMKDAYERFYELVERVGVRRRVHETMDAYKKMVEELQLKLISNSLTIEHLDKCESWISNSIQIFSLMSKQFGNDNGSLFYLMCVKIGNHKHSTK